MVHHPSLRPGRSPHSAFVEVPKLDTSRGSLSGLARRFRCDGDGELPDPRLLERRTLVLGMALGEVQFTLDLLCRRVNSSRRAACSSRVGPLTRSASSR